MTRFVDDVSALAIEDCLISKLPTLFRSSNVLAMSIEDISRLAGETQASSIERTRLEAKRKILETGLQSLKSLHKRRNLVNRSKKHQGARDFLGQMSTMTTSRSEEASITPSGAEPASPAIIHEEPSADSEEIAPTIDESQDQPEVRSDTVDNWLRQSLSKKEKKKLLKQGINQYSLSSLVREGSSEGP